MKKYIYLILSVILILTLCVSCSGKKQERTLSGKTYSGPAWVVDQSKTYYAEIDTTEGMMKMLLFDDAAPFAVNSFIYLATEEFFNNMYFFRTIDGFMIQTGDPNHLGTGDAGYRFESELPVPYIYEPGIVAMANSGNNGSNGSQWFICTGEQSTTLNYNPIYVEIGYIYEGLDVAKKIAAKKVTENPLTGEVSYPTDPTYINSIQIFVVNENIQMP